MYKEYINKLENRITGTDFLVTSEKFRGELWAGILKIYNSKYVKNNNRK